MDIMQQGQKLIKQLNAEYVGKEVIITEGKFKGRKGRIKNLRISYPFNLSSANAFIEVYFKNGSLDRSGKPNVILDYAYNQHWHTLDTLEILIQENEDAKTDR